jgi:hypothetical protein
MIQVKVKCGIQSGMFLVFYAVEVYKGGLYAHVTAAAEYNSVCWHHLE